MKARTLTIALLFLFCASCGDGQEDEPSRPNRVSIVQSSAWGEVEAGPLGPSPACVDLGAREEEGAIDLDTGYCDPIVVGQTITEDVYEGEQLKLLITHFPIIPDSPGLATVELSIGEDVVWQTEIPMPSGTGVLSPSFRAERSYPAGTQAALRIENHGENTWRIVSLTTGPEEAE